MTGLERSARDDKGGRGAQDDRTGERALSSGRPITRSPDHPIPIHPITL
jgi:hypothetical protein